MRICHIYTKASNFKVTKYFVFCMFYFSLRTRVQITVITDPSQFECGEKVSLDLENSINFFF